MTGELNLQDVVNKAQATGNVNMKYAGRPNWRRIFREHQKNYEKQGISYIVLRFAFFVEL